MRHVDDFDSNVLEKLSLEAHQAIGLDFYVCSKCGWPSTTMGEVCGRQLFHPPSLPCDGVTGMPSHPEYENNIAQEIKSWILLQDRLPPTHLPLAIWYGSWKDKPEWIRVTVRYVKDGVSVVGEVSAPTESLALRLVVLPPERREHYCKLLGLHYSNVL